MSWLVNSNYIFIISGLFSALITVKVFPFVKNIGLKFKVIDDPDPRKMHSKPTVRLGGLTLIISFVFTVSLIYFFINDQNFIDKHIDIILLSAAISFVIGMLDDIFTVPYFFRLIGQIIVSIMIWQNGINITFIDLSFLPFLSNNYFYLNDSFSLIINILWFCGVINSINWIDGLDGLAAGISLIICFGLAFISIANGNLSIALLSIILAGSCLGFLKNNFYPAKIMMGDGGSYFLGTNIALLSFLAVAKSDGQINLFIPFTLLIVPILDMTYVIISRIQNKLSPFYPDRRHLHHRLINYGFSYKKTVCIIYLLNFIAVSLSIRMNS